MIKAIIFDFDGVLVESVDVKTQAFAKLFEQHGPEVTRRVVEHHLRNGGMSRFEKIKYYYSHILNKPLSNSELDSLCRRFAGMVVDNVVNAPFVKGADSFLKNNYTKFELFVVSGTPEIELTAIVKHRKMDCFFKGLFGSPENKVTLTRRVIERYKLDKRNVIFVGDSFTDYEAASENGVLFIGRVAPGHGNFFSEGTILIPDLTQLENILEC